MGILRTNKAEKNSILQSYGELAAFGPMEENKRSFPGENETV